MSVLHVVFKNFLYTFWILVFFFLPFMTLECKRGLEVLAIFFPVALFQEFCLTIFTLVLLDVLLLLSCWFSLNRNLKWSLFLIVVITLCNRKPSISFRGIDTFAMHHVSVAGQIHNWTINHSALLFCWNVTAV